MRPSRRPADVFRVSADETWILSEAGAMKKEEGTGIAALALRGGGVGIYPASDFVHVDVGRVRSW